MSGAPDDRLAQVHQRLTEAVTAITSGEEWAAMLAVAARFRDYSPNNVFLITLARPDATRVAGYNTWKTLGRQVRAGERGIPILAPVLRRPSLTNRGHGYVDPEDEPVERVVAGFRIVHVFDESQTDGPPIPEVTPRLLEGSGPEGAFDVLASHVGSLGFEVRRAPLHPANGMTDYVARSVIVADRLGGAAALKTLAHEAGHCHLHGEKAPAGMTRRLAEVEAESVAYIVCAELGLASDDYSFGYTARWSGGDTNLVAEAAARSISAAREVLDAVAPRAAEPGPATKAVLAVAGSQHPQSSPTTAPGPPRTHSRSPR